MPTPEALAREPIDQKLTAACWIVQELSLSTYFRHQSLDYRPDWVDDTRAARLQISIGDSD